MTHALIVGPRHVGKTTLIDRVLAELGRPVCGFQTKKETEFADEQGREPVYIYLPGKPRFHTAENLVGYCSAKGFTTVPGVFHRYAAHILRPVPREGVLVFDEIGFMEAKEQAFCQAIFSRLEGDVPVIAAVKNNTGFAFLEQVRSHPNCRCFSITAENRDELFGQVLDFMRVQLESAAAGGKDG
ncbi:MAG: nucleoside-triphosphatase [Firmicutes bacterium]|nr:nucleoside-triphosphatase [Bacillota bacterium]